jgi:DNA-binding transcriptional LysR family regulator
MELRHLRYFEAVARTLHFGQAAEQVHVAQPALSRAVSQLERELGVTLLRRTTRTVQLTEAGRVYLAEVRAILARVEEATRAARQAEGGMTGTIRIGLTGSASYGYLPRIARVLSASLPQVHMRVRTEMLTPEQERALADDDLDLAVLRPPLATGGLDHAIVEREELLLAVPGTHPLAGAEEPVAVADLRGEPLVLYAASTGSVVLDAVQRACRGAGFDPQPAHQVSETSTMLALVAAGLGVALVPEAAGALTLPGVVFRRTDSPVTVELALAWRRDDDSPVLRQVLSALRHHDLLPALPDRPAQEAS